MIRYKVLKMIALTATIAAPAASLAGTINVKPGDNIAQIVAAAPAGTSFVFAAGTYRMPQIVAKTGDTFSGPGTGKAVLDGGQPYTFTQVSGSSTLWQAKIGAQPLDIGRCQAGHPLCHYTRELFFDSNLFMPVGTLGELTKNTWYYDSSTGNAIISVNPTSHSVLVGTTVCAFCGYANNVTVKNLTVMHYAAPSTTGAIGQNATNSNWTVSNVEGRYNHGAAVFVGPNSTVENSYLHHNGQKGLGGHGANLVIQGNELAYNGYDWFDYAWETGGAKFGGLESAEIINNYVHDNNGNGLWDDGNGIYVHYKGNNIVNNLGSGIQHEIGYNAVIEENTITRNGKLPRVSMWDGQISVQNSSHTTVQNNTVIVAADYGSGLVIINQVRTNPPGPYGPYIGAYNTIIDNDITYEGTNGAGGIMGVTSTGVGNVIDNNTYHIKPALNKHHFEAFGVKTFPQFQSAGYDPNGKIAWVQ